MPVNLNRIIKQLEGKKYEHPSPDPINPKIQFGTYKEGYNDAVDLAIKMLKLSRGDKSG